MASCKNNKTEKYEIRLTELTNATLPGKLPEPAVR